MRFSKDSFTDEITTKEEAQNSLTYFMQNLQEFQKELFQQGTSYEDTVDMILDLWRNLIQSSKRVGYTNKHLTDMHKLLTIEE